MDVIGILYVYIMARGAALLLMAALGAGLVLLLALRVRAGLRHPSPVHAFERSVRDLFPGTTAYRCLACG